MSDNDEDLLVLQGKRYWKQKRWSKDKKVNVRTTARHRQRGLPCVAIRRRDSRLEQADHAGQQPLVGAPHYRLARAPSRTRFMLASRRCGVPGTPVARPGASLARR